MSTFSFSHDGSISFKKRKARFTFTEVHILLDEVRKNRHIVVGKFNRGVPTAVKKRTWAQITACINEIGECQREVIEVIKKWSDLKCDTKRKVAAMRAGTVPYRGINSYFSRELSPVENIVHQILELDGKRGKLPTFDSNVYLGMGLGEEEGGDEEEEEEDVTLGMPSSSIHNSNSGEMDVPTKPLPPHPLGMPVPLSIPMTVPSSVSVPLSIPMSIPMSLSLPFSVPSSMSVPMYLPLSIPMPVSMAMPSVSLLHQEDHAIPSPMYCARSRDTSLPPFEMQYEIPSSEDQELQLIGSDEECQENALPPIQPPPTATEEGHLLALPPPTATEEGHLLALPPPTATEEGHLLALPPPTATEEGHLLALQPPTPTEEGHLLASLQHVTTSATPSHPPSSSPSSSGPQTHSQPGPSARDKLLHCASLSTQEQHNTNILLETVSRSLELLSESVQQLVETQQEFVRDSLRLQRETVHILHGFASGAISLMHDKLNGRPAL